jgi:hypothetical protein
MRHRMWIRRYRRRYPVDLDLLLASSSEAETGGDDGPLLDPTEEAARADDVALEDPTGYKTYWVMQQRHGWIVRRDDSQIAILPTRTAALTLAVLRAHDDQPSEVVILGPDGEIEEKWSFEGG